MLTEKTGKKGANPEFHGVVGRSFLTLTRARTPRKTPRAPQARKARKNSGCNSDSVRNRRFSKAVGSGLSRYSVDKRTRKALRIISILALFYGVKKFMVLLLSLPLFIESQKSASQRQDEGGGEGPRKLRKRRRISRIEPLGPQTLRGFQATKSPHHRVWRAAPSSCSSRPNGRGQTGEPFRKSDSRNGLRKQCNRKRGQCREMIRAW